MIGQEYSPTDVRHGRTPPRVHDCPACDGIMPIDAIAIGPWRIIVPAERPGCWRRRLTLHCPHCDYRESRTEEVPIAF